MNKDVAIAVIIVAFAAGLLSLVMIRRISQDESTDTVVIPETKLAEVAAEDPRLAEIMRIGQGDSFSDRDADLLLDVLSEPLLVTPEDTDAIVRYRWALVTCSDRLQHCLMSPKTKSQLEQAILVATNHPVPSIRKCAELAAREAGLTDGS